jgi:hypothetical protein
MSDIGDSFVADDKFARQICRLTFSVKKPPKDEFMTRVIPTSSKINAIVLARVSSDRGPRYGIPIAL